MKLIKTDLYQMNIANDSCKDYEPDGKDLAEWMADTEQDPNYDPEDHYISIQTDIALGK